MEEREPEVRQDPPAAVPAPPAPKPKKKRESYGVILPILIILLISVGICEFALLSYIVAEGAPVVIARLSEERQTAAQEPAEEEDTPPETAKEEPEPEVEPEAEPEPPPAADPAPVETSTESPSQTDIQGTYVGSLDSDKYHSPSCQHAGRILEENEIWFTSGAEAQAAGYTPCGTCKP